MKKYVIHSGICLLRREFESTGGEMIVRVSADPHSYLHEYCQPVNSFGLDGLWAIGGSFIKFRLWVDGKFIGLGPFRTTDNAIAARHEFQIKPLPGRHVIAAVYLGNSAGFNVELENASFASEWKLFDADKIYRHFNPDHPGVDGYFKGDVGVGEYREHIDGLVLPEGWRMNGFDDSLWPTASIAELERKEEQVPYEFVTERLNPASVRRTAEGHVLIDFGREVIGSVRLRGPMTGGEVEVRLAEEMQDADRIRFEFRRYMICYQEIWRFGKGGQWLENFGLREFRYAELVGYPGPFQAEDIYVDTIHAPFDDSSAILQTDSENLNAVWNLCKYTVKVTAMDLFTDCFHRERNAYEADGLINLLAYAAAGGTPEVAKRTVEYLAKHPTWPLDWRLQTPLLFDEYYWESGDLSPVEKNFDYLRDYCSFSEIRKDGWVQCFPVNPLLIDWPINYQEATDIGNGEFLTMPNALSGLTLKTLSSLATYLGRIGEAEELAEESRKVFKALNRDCFDPEKGLYRDRPESKNASFHTNLWMLRSGGVPSECVKPILDFITRCGMQCSLYTAFHYLDTLFHHGRGDWAYSFLVREGQDSWMDMIRHSCTLTTEYWYEPERRMSLAHPWGASPAYLIARHVFGIRPLEPGWMTYAIEPVPTPLSGSGARLLLRKKCGIIESVL